jgi:ATP-binding protein involved in chromosome partitioning
MFQMPNINVPILGIVENMAWFTPAELPNNKYYIFGQDGGRRLAGELNLPLLGQIPIVQSIRESGDSGVPAVLAGEPITKKAFQDLAFEVARQVSMRNAGQAPTKPVTVNA